MTQLPSDPLLSVLVELRDLKIRVANAIALVNEAIIAQSSHALKHDFAPPPHVAPFCAEAMDAIEP